MKEVVNRKHNFNSGLTKSVLNIFCERAASTKIINYLATYLFICELSNKKRVANISYSAFKNYLFNSDTTISRSIKWLLGNNLIDRPGYYKPHYDKQGNLEVEVVTYKVIKEPTKSRSTILFWENRDKWAAIDKKNRPLAMCIYAMLTGDKKFQNPIIKVSTTELANMLGTSKPTIIKGLNCLKEVGLIEEELKNGDKSTYYLVTEYEFKEEEKEEIVSVEEEKIEERGGENEEDFWF